MSKLSSPESFAERPSSDEERLKKAIAEIERVSAEIKFEQAVDEINHVANMLRLRSGGCGIAGNSNAANHHDPHHSLVRAEEARSLADKTTDTELRLA